MKVTKLSGQAVFDSNGVPTIEVEIVFDHRVVGRAMAQRGSTTGDYEGHVLEDPLAGATLAAVAPALAALDAVVSPAVVGVDVDQRQLDDLLGALDGSPTRWRVGANVMVAVSMAAAKALATSTRGSAMVLEPPARSTLPTPMFNVMDGAQRPGSATAYVEFLVLPRRGMDVPEALELGVAARRGVHEVLVARGVECGDSPQGSWWVDLGDCERMLDVLVQGTERAGYAAWSDFTVGLDLSAAEYVADGSYTYGWEGGQGHWQNLLKQYERWLTAFPLSYLEDAFAPHDEEAWTELTSRLGATVIIAGDDLFASQTRRIRRGIAMGLANGCLVKPNQVGTVTESLDALAAANAAGFSTVVSQRSGENDDAFITHLAVTGQASWLKAGGMSRMDRVTKYNELLRIARTASGSGGLVRSTAADAYHD